jgi:hypothetical protein
LAVVLTVFTAQVEGDHVLVTWETASEINNQGFNLYRSVAPGGRCHAAPSRLKVAVK